tara:strand:+ start:1752 stop:3542 length:1791 start_codon:yes stop_codon:yes gene_type:complete
MPELKHGFGAAKMNKDADERTVPNGEYRDALNVQIATSDGSDVGTLQTLLGNTKINYHAGQFQAELEPFYSKCWGSVADESNNKIYYFVSDTFNTTDYIFEYTVPSVYSAGILKVVAVDKYNISVNISTISSGAPSNPNRMFKVAPGDHKNIRPGMRVSGVFTGGLSVNFTDELKVIKLDDQTTHWEILMDLQSNAIGATISLDTAVGQTLSLEADRVLNFTSTITGINVLDGVIYWTDGNSEPKKINISNIETDASGLFHSKFIVKDNNGNQITDDLPSGKIDFRSNPEGLKEENLTVVKKSPLHPPTLLFSNTSDFRFTNGASSLLAASAMVNFVDDNGDPIENGGVMNVTFNPIPNYVVGDKILFSRFNNFGESLVLTDYEVIVELLEYDSTTGVAKIKIVFITGLDGVTGQEMFHCILQQEAPLYEFKFPRFAYRYKYQDDQYSAYSPFSEPAFLPGNFTYKPKDGYNMGMVNTLRSLYVMDFVPDRDTLPKDVVAIDIVYKESNSNNVYIVETIEHGDDEWEARGSDINTDASIYARTKGALLITSEMVKAAVASNQLLRPWDNVPRTAKAQEVIGNRLVYANYLQNYNLN